MKNAGKSLSFFAFIILLGGITGSLVGDILGNITSLNFLTYVYKIGTTTPISIDLKVAVITFGLNLNVNIMSIIGIIVAIILYRKY